MKRLLLATSLAALTGTAAAQVSSGSDSHSGADAGAFASTGAITFEASKQRGSQRVHTTPSVYVPPAAMGGANNCGTSNTAGVSVTGFGVGGAVASESDACNAREDATMAARLGFMRVAELRFFCHGTPESRRAYQDAGHACPKPVRTAEEDAIYSGDDPIIRARLGLPPAN